MFGQAKSLARRLSVAAAICVGSFSVASAQEGGDPDLGATIWQSRSTCVECHGWSGNGVPENPQAPYGANLRATFLNAEQLKEVISCGRPYTEMPSFRRNAWSESFPCFGMTSIDADGMPPTGSFQNDRNIDALVAYILRDLVGAGQITSEECQAYFGAGDTRCANYPSAAAAPASP